MFLSISLGKYVVPVLMGANPLLLLHSDGRINSRVSVGEHCLFDWEARFESVRMLVRIVEYSFFWIHVKE